MTKPVMSIDTVNSIAYELAHDLDLNEKMWIIPALSGHIHYLAQLRLSEYEQNRCQRLIDQWIMVRQGKLNPVPRSLP